MITTRRIHSWEWSSSWCKEDDVNLDCEFRGRADFVSLAIS